MKTFAGGPAPQGPLAAAIVAAMTDTIVLVDEMGRVLFLATEIDTIFGMEPSNWIGQSALDFIHPEDLHKVAPKLRDAVTGDAIRREFLRVRIGLEGNWFPVELHGFNPITFEGTPAALISIRDTTGGLWMERARKIADDSLSSDTAGALDSEDLARAFLSFRTDQQTLLMHIRLTSYESLAALHGVDHARRVITEAAGRIVAHSRTNDLVALVAADALLVLYVGIDTARHAQQLAERVFLLCVDDPAPTGERDYVLGYALASEGDDFAAVQEFAAAAAQFST